MEATGFAAGLPALRFREKGWQTSSAIPVFRQVLDQAPEENPQAAITHFISIFSNPALTWDHLAFLRQHTRLPILLKGILHPADALKAIEYKVDGIIVSNHGGRQLDERQGVPGRPS